MKTKVEFNEVEMLCLRNSLEFVCIELENAFPRVVEVLTPLLVKLEQEEQTQNPIIEN